MQCHVSDAKNKGTFSGKADGALAPAANLSPLYATGSGSATIIRLN